MKQSTRARDSGNWKRFGAALGSTVLSFLCATQFLAARPPAAETGTISQITADDLVAKIAALNHSTARGSGSLQPVTITDEEANSYLKFRGHEFLPPAVRDAEIHIQPDQIAGAADVDFDELGQMGSQSDDWGAKLITYVFKGKQRVTAAGTLETGKGEGKFVLTSLSVGTTSLPAGFVNFLLQSYVEKQYKIDLSKPFPLPPNVSHIELSDGRATLRRIALTRR